jgi:hypothetical protein
MRPAVIALSLTTAAFAASTVYFARELRVERASAAASPPVYSSTSAVEAPGNAIEPSPAPAPTTVTFATLTGPGAMAGDAPAPHSNTQALIQAEQRRYHEQIIKRLDDPEQRAEMLEEYRMIVSSLNPRLAQTLKMSGEEAERLIELLAQQQLTQQEKFARCAVDSSCDFQPIGRDEAGANERELANLLGAERRQEFEQYRNTMSERRSVTELRTRLSDADYLPDEKAEALIDALADERNQISVDASKRGGGVTGIGNGNGTGIILITPSSDSPEAQFASAQENSRRLRTRAAEVLTSAQQRVFEEMQEELLRSTRQQLRQAQHFNAATITSAN